MKRVPFLIACLLAPGALAAGDAHGDGEEGAGRLYVTSSERREGGLKHRMASWLEASLLLELDGETENLALQGGDRERQNGAGASLQLGLVLSPRPGFKVEGVFELDSEGGQPVIDELYASLEVGDLELEAGRLYSPFGAYISHFATGPLLERAETRVDGLLLSFGSSERLELSAALYRSRVDRGPGWALAAESWITSRLVGGLAFQSDLLDAGDWGSSGTERVPALAGYAVWSLEAWEFSAELLGALRRHRDGERLERPPLGWNLELARYGEGGFAWALRLEGSDRFPEAPRWRSGLSLSWRFLRDATFTLDYLAGRYRGAGDRSEWLAAQFSVFF